MTDPAVLATAFISGILLGLFVFGGLWWTVRRGLPSSDPALWFGISSLVRLAGVIGTFYYMSLIGLASVGVCLLGLLATRFAVTHLIRSHKARAATDS